MANNKFYLLGAKKKFGGKIYTVTGRYGTKAEATRQARNVRKSGDFARITSFLSPRGIMFYILWTRG